MKGRNKESLCKPLGYWTASGIWGFACSNFTNERKRVEKRHTNEKVRIKKQ